MKRRIITTEDGSTTIQIEDWDEQYHSKHGAIQEAYHVFIKNGLELFSNREISILEIGFGTGLNALITFLEHSKQNLEVNYEGVEAYPISSEEAQAMNYARVLGDELQGVFEKMHQSEWEKEISLSETFQLKKRKLFFQEIEAQEKFHLIYFYAFGAQVQPELWTEEIFQKMYNSLKENGVLVTYAAKGSVRRAMLSVGFQVEKLPGPPGKREMLRARKITA